jgi:hypothetical protein
MKRREKKYAENTGRPLSSSAIFPSLAVQTFCRPEEKEPQREGSTQRIPGNRCLPLRPSHLSRFKLSAGPKEKNRRGRKYAENTRQSLSSSATFPSLAVQIFCRPEEKEPQRGKYAENTGQPLSSSASFPSLAVQTFSRHEEKEPQRSKVRREYPATVAFLCVLPISCGSNFLPTGRKGTAEGGRSQRISRAQIDRSW